MTESGAESGLQPYAERLILEALARGDFDALPGLGEPIPGAGQVDDELWWIREWIRRNDPGPRGDRHHQSPADGD